VWSPCPAAAAAPVPSLTPSIALAASLVRVAVCTPAASADQRELALNVTVQALAFFESYFAVPFPLPQLVLAGIPDFSAGAMVRLHILRGPQRAHPPTHQSTQKVHANASVCVCLGGAQENWGLITFTETALLWDPRRSGARTAHNVATTVVHELAHQWHGNLVTMAWWCVRVAVAGGTLFVPLSVCDVGGAARTHTGTSCGLTKGLPRTWSMCAWALCSRRGPCSGHSCS
jgi:hypothetical protein